jgi:putative membrane protein insertion efficiency factor
MRKLAVILIDIYKKYISPGLPPSCRFYPTCSQYARDAIIKYGVLKGGVMALWRLLRCNPFNKGGYDPLK